MGDDGIRWEADPRHAELISESLGLEQCLLVGTPGKTPEHPDDTLQEETKDDANIPNDQHHIHDHATQHNLHEHDSPKPPNDHVDMQLSQNDTVPTVADADADYKHKNHARFDLN